MVGISKAKALLDEERYSEAFELIEEIVRAKIMEDNRAWLVENLTPQVEALNGKADQFEDEMFTDLTMKDYEEELGATFAIGDEGEEQKYIVDIVEPGSVTIHDWIIKIDNSLNCDGRCVPLEKTIYINSEHTDDETLMHEMIHAYESMLPECYRQYIVLRLYQKLSAKIPNLMELIHTDMHAYFLEHTLFFMLKSLDLDLRLEKPLGTIYSYGRAEIYTGRKELQNKLNELQGSPKQVL